MKRKIEERKKKLFDLWTNKSLQFMFVLCINYSTTTKKIKIEENWKEFSGKFNEKHFNIASHIGVIQISFKSHFYNWIKTLVSISSQAKTHY